MTLREESGDGPPADRETGAHPQEPPATPESAESHAPPAGPSPAAAAAPPGTPPHPREPPAAPESAESHASPVDPPAAAPPGLPASPREPPGTPDGRRRSRAAFLIGGSAAICLAGLGTFATVLLLHGPPHAGPTPLPPVFRLRTGQCINSGPGGVSSPAVVPCRRPHDAEIYATFVLAGRQWPGGAAVGTRARQGCTARLGGYLNPQLATAILAESYIFPDHGAWNAGERAVICEIRSTTGKLTGSVRGLG